MVKSLLLISRHSPWSGMAAREVLDIALTGGAFDLPITLLFLDDGVLQLVINQQPLLIQQKDLTANLSALPFFGIETLYAARSSLDERGIHSHTLIDSVSILDNQEITTLIDSHHYVITL